MIKRQSDAELKQLAKDIVAGKVFHSGMLHESDSHIAGSIFMPLTFMTAKQMKALRKDNPGLIYEYMDKAGPRAINGYPIFTSCRMLNQKDLEKLREYIVKVQEALASV